MNRTFLWSLSLPTKTSLSPLEFSSPLPGLSHVLHSFFFFLVFPRSDRSCGGICLSQGLHIVSGSFLMLLWTQLLFHERILTHFYSVTALIISILAIALSCVVSMQLPPPSENTCTPASLGCGRRQERTDGTGLFLHSLAETELGCSSCGVA